MERLQHLDSTGVRGLIFDIDDTVTRDGVLEPAAYAAMHRLAGSGFHLISVTGRPLGWADVIARQWPVAVAVGENGAGWSWIAEDRFTEGYFCAPNDRANQGAVLEAIREHVAREMPHVRVTSDHRARRCDLAFDVGELVSLPRADIDQLVDIIERHGALSSVSTVHAHAAPGPWNKADGVVRAAREVLGVDVEAELDRWVFVGDSGNDAEAFARFPKSVGVANVRDHLDRLRTPPRYVTHADRGHGFAELATHLLGSDG